ncbi:Ppx/GppA phosphatase family protein [Candidatus Contubernalis alkaliaceticus]|uniref:Ppx/GppA phosphatase family protein n=1 Tax=Candidatus Contubernalis alkaliaceticus TaxID=338645 RepID=UPI001F4C35B7|nr:Ppx/GppA phosphatase family protein [Candidatus Contubernalis alkalaceticus]UNC90713.1 Ppx/GppA family phosphatase [Candidatus Contubernalis alkalaceticus]
MYFAVMDLGTNSVRLLIARKAPQGNYIPCYCSNEITRLGEGTAKQGELKGEAVERTLEIVNNYLQVIKEHQANLTVVMATSAVREARNREILIDRLKKETGVNLTVLSGVQEAELSYLGVINTIVPTEKPLIFDLGGGSTELIWQQGEQLKFKSLKLGVVRLTEAFIASDPPGVEEVRKVEQYTRNLIYPVKAEMKEEFKQLIGVGGTITSLASIKQELKVYDSTKVHGFILTVKEISDILTRLCSVKEEDRQKFIGLQPQRADVIVAGTAIILAFMKQLHFHQVMVSEGDLLLGALHKFN